MTTSIDTHTAIIGAGPGGYVAAIRLAQLGIKAVLIEKGPLGGVCLNWGCIPSKALIHAAAVYESVLGEKSEAAQMGIGVPSASLDVAQLQAWKQGIVNKLTGGIGQLMKSHGVTVLKGTAQFTSAHSLSVVTDDPDPTHLTFQNAIIATGAAPIALPPFPIDGTHIIDSKEALSLNAIPESLAILGGGVIGLEIGVMYAKLGSQVTIIEQQPQLLPGMDAEIASLLGRLLKRRKITVYLDTTATQATVDPNQGVTLILNHATKGDKTIVATKLLVAVGRKATTAGLNIEATGLVPDPKRGTIAIDAQCRTTIPHLYAIGDVTPGPQLAHKASHQGLVAAEAIASKATGFDAHAIPGAVFTDPEVATVGLSEADADTQGLAITVGKFPFAASGRALSRNAPEGFVKVIADANTNRVLGVHMIGPEVSELLGEATLAIEMGATVQDLALTIHPHPTLSESLLEAAEAVHHQAIHIYQPT
jgi:dihydrolipoamide dehydrogenase